MASLAVQTEKVKSWLNGHKPLLTRETARVAYSKTYFDNRKILQALPGFSFTPLRQTIENACAKYKMHLQTAEMAK